MIKTFLAFTFIAYGNLAMGNCEYKPDQPVWLLPVADYCPQQTALDVAITSPDGIDREHICFTDENDYFRWMSGNCIDIETTEVKIAIKQCK